MRDLIAFVKARLDEDEAAARAADETVLPGDLPRETHIVYGLQRAGFGNAYQGFVLVHDPARVLREVEAGRAVLELHEPLPSTYGEPVTCPTCWPEPRVGTHPLAPCPTLRQLASIWNDHPDYNPAWRR